MDWLLSRIPYGAHHKNSFVNTIITPSTTDGISIAAAAVANNIIATTNTTITAAYNRNNIKKLKKIIIDIISDKIEVTK